jgi:uncharacterized membrane protein
MSSPRHPEIDLLRTIAIVLMVVYHAAYDLEVFYGWEIGVFESGWRLLQQSIAVLFLLLSGASFVLAHKRARERGNPWRRHLRRAMQVLAAAMLVTLATWIFDPSTYVRFGILHLIGVGILLLPLFSRLREATILLGALFITAGPWIQTLTTSSSVFLPLGITPSGFNSVDYFPLFPWFGVMLIGSGIGHFLYLREHLWQFPVASRQSLVALLTWPGRYSLMIYLVHQPVLLGTLYLFLGKV